MTTELIPMRADQIEEVADLLTRNFLSNNPIWKTFQLDNKEVYKFFVDELKLHLDSQEVIRKEINPAIEFNMVFLVKYRSTFMRENSLQLVPILSFISILKQLILLLKAKL